MLDIQTGGGGKQASRMVRLVMAHREANARVHKRDTMADFWAKRLLDQEIVEDYEPATPPPPTPPPRRGQDSFVQSYGGGCCT